MGKDINEQKKLMINMCQRMTALGLTYGTWGNISFLTGDSDKVIITPSGMKYDTLKPDDLVVVDLDGNVLEGNRRPSIETPMHTAIYRKRTDVGSVVHTHSIFATASAVARVPVPAVVEDMAQIVGGAAEVAKYSLPGTKELADNVVDALGSRNAVLLANHGMVGVGSTVEEAFEVCQIVEKTARIHAYSKLFGEPVILSEEDVAEMHEFYMTKYKQV